MTETEFHQWLYDEMMRAYPDPVDYETGYPLDDWGYTNVERRGFVAGAIDARNMLIDAGLVTGEVE